MMPIDVVVEKRPPGASSYYSRELEAITVTERAARRDASDFG